MSEAKQGRGGGQGDASRPLTTGQVARLCHVSTVTVRNWIRAGKIEAYKLPGGHYRITPEAFEAFVQRYSIPTSAESQMPPKNP